MNPHVRDCFNSFKTTYFLYVDYKLYYVSGPHHYTEYLILIEEALKIIKVDRRPVKNNCLEIEDLFVSVILSDTKQVVGIGISKYKKCISKQIKMWLSYEKLLYDCKLLEDGNNRALLDRYLDNVIESEINLHSFVLYVFTLNTSFIKSKEKALDLIKEHCFCNRIFTLSKYDEKVICMCIIDESLYKVIDIYEDIKRLIYKNEIMLVIYSAMAEVLLKNRAGTLLNLSKCENEIYQLIRSQDNENHFKKI